MDEKHKELLSLERGALIADIVGGVAVVISIIYLAYQVGENTDALKVQTSQALLELHIQRAGWYQELDHAELMLQGDSKPSSLTAVEWAKYSKDKATAFNLWEQANYGYRLGGVDEEQWASWDRYFASSVCTPGTLYFWEMERHAWGEYFQEHIDKHLANCKRAAKNSSSGNQQE